jgi:DNA-binding transcriptional ArsR family regulator
MKPLVHPDIEDVPLEVILHALADPIRVALFYEIVYQEGPKNCIMLVNVLDQPIPKSTLSQHMRVLREAGLVRGERHGTQMHNTSRYDEVDARYPGLLLAIITAHSVQMEAKKKQADAVAASREPIAADDLYL